MLRTDARRSETLDDIRGADSGLVHGGHPVLHAIAFESRHGYAVRRQGVNETARGDFER